MLPGLGFAIPQAQESPSGSRYGRTLAEFEPTSSHTPEYPDPAPVPRPAVNATFVAKRLNVLAAGASPPLDHADDWHV